jgi:ParB family transcriptional regulator, chromosome partitioning protein
MAKPSNELAMVYRSVDDLIPYARNSRTHSEEQVAQIAASMREFGFTNPVLLDDQSGIIAGHGRVQAALKVGIKEVPTITLGHLTETQRRAYVIADNKLALNAGWDAEMLALEFADLQADGFDVELTGFDLDEISALTGAAKEVELPALNDGDREPFQQMTFTVHDEQKEQIDAALAAAKAMGPFDSPNENSNGNALARVCETFLTVAGHG